MGHRFTHSSFARTHFGFSVFFRRAFRSEEWSADSKWGKKSVVWILQFFPTQTYARDAWVCIWCWWSTHRSKCLAVELVRVVWLIWLGSLQRCQASTHFSWKATRKHIFSPMWRAKVSSNTLQCSWKVSWPQTQISIGWNWSSIDSALMKSVKDGPIDLQLTCSCRWPVENWQSKLISFEKNDDFIGGQRPCLGVN